MKEKRLVILLSGCNLTIKLCKLPNLVIKLENKLHSEIYRAKGHSLALILLLFHSFFSTSLIPGLIGISPTFIVLSNFIMIFLLIFHYGRTIKSWAIILTLLVLSTTLFKVLEFGEPFFFKINVYLILTFSILSVVRNNEIVVFTEISSKFLLIFLIGACIAIALNIIGLSYIYSYVAANGREQFFYYTSFGHLHGAVLRPSGIYDEPGTLAFMLASILVLRRIFDLNQKHSLVLLFLGFSTFSVAYVVFSFFYLFSMNLNGKNRRTTFLLILVFITGSSFSGFIDLFQSAVINRVEIGGDAIHVSGGRQSLMELAQYNLSTTRDAYLWGVDPFCTINNEACLSKGYMSENPLAPLAEHGLFIAWPYYLFLSLLVILSFKGRKYLIYLAIGSIFLQRPYLLNYGVSLLGILPIYLYYVINRHENLDK